MATEQDRRRIVWSEAGLEQLYAGRSPRRELIKCWESLPYFVEEYVWIYNATERAWLKFFPWPAQLALLRDLEQNRFLTVLKARQLGISWLVLTYALWLMLFRPVSSVLLMSKRDDEAVELLANRLTRMHALLPPWLQARKVVKASSHALELSTGSRALAFPTSGGRSYTGTFVLLDEADFVPNLGEVLNALRPTVDAGGQLVMVSTVDKTVPVSEFKQIYRAALRGDSEYAARFLPWHARPDRTEEWYAALKRAKLAETGSLDDVYQEYPATVEEALMPLQLDKRLAYAWLEACHTAQEPVQDAGPALAALRVYAPVQAGRAYVVGGDPAEGNPRSDDSVAVVLDASTWEEVAVWGGRFEPDVFAAGIAQLALYYNRAAVLIERNNHGHAVIGALKTLGGVRLLQGHDAAHLAPGSPPAAGERLKAGWLSNEKGKALLYDLAAEALRDGATLFHTPDALVQLASIEASTLRAPSGLHDDYAMAYVLALMAARLGGGGLGEASTVIPAGDVLAEWDKADW